MGAGLGALLAQFARPYALGLIVIGIGLHGLAMVEKRRLEAGEAIPRWSKVLYWICWLALAAILAWIGIGASWK